MREVLNVVVIGAVVFAAMMALSQCANNHERVACDAAGGRALEYRGAVGCVMPEKGGRP